MELPNCEASKLFFSNVQAHEHLIANEYQHSGKIFSQLKLTSTNSQLISLYHYVPQLMRVATEDSEPTETDFLDPLYNRIDQL